MLLLKKCLVYPTRVQEVFYKYGDEVSNTTLALVDNKDEGQEIDPKAVVQNFQNLPNRYYFDENGHRVVNIPRNDHLFRD